MLLRCHGTAPVSSMADDSEADTVHISRDSRSRRRSRLTTPTATTDAPIDPRIRYAAGMASDSAATERSMASTPSTVSSAG